MEAPADRESRQTGHGPILFGLACREAKIWLGIEISKDWTVTSVARHSAADRIGLKAGDRLGNINDNYLPDSPLPMIAMS